MNLDKLLKGRPIQYSEDRVQTATEVFRKAQALDKSDPSVPQLTIEALCILFSSGLDTQMSLFQILQQVIKQFSGEFSNQQFQPQVLLTQAEIFYQEQQICAILIAQFVEAKKFGALFLKIQENFVKHYSDLSVFKYEGSKAVIRKIQQFFVANRELFVFDIYYFVEISKSQSEKIEKLKAAAKACEASCFSIEPKAERLIECIYADFFTNLEVQQQTKLFQSCVECLEKLEIFEPTNIFGVLLMPSYKPVFIAKFKAILKVYDELFNTSVLNYQYKFEFGVQLPALFVYLICQEKELFQVFVLILGGFLQKSEGFAHKFLKTAMPSSDILNPKVCIQLVQIQFPNVEFAQLKGLKSLEGVVSFLQQVMMNQTVAFYLFTAFTNVQTEDYTFNIVAVSILIIAMFKNRKTINQLRSNSFKLTNKEYLKFISCQACEYDDNFLLQFSFLFISSSSLKNELIQAMIKNSVLIPENAVLKSQLTMKVLLEIDFQNFEVVYLNLKSQSMFDLVSLRALVSIILANIFLKFSHQKLFISNLVQTNKNLLCNHSSHLVELALHQFQEVKYNLDILVDHQMICIADGQSFSKTLNNFLMLLGVNAFELVKSHLQNDNQLHILLESIQSLDQMIERVIFNEEVFELFLSQMIQLFDDTDFLCQHTVYFRTAFNLQNFQAIIRLKTANLRIKQKTTFLETQNLENEVDYDKQTKFDKLLGINQSSDVQIVANSSNTNKQVATTYSLTKSFKIESIDENFINQQENSAKEEEVQVVDEIQEIISQQIFDQSEISRPTCNSHQMDYSDSEDHFNVVCQRTDSQIIQNVIMATTVKQGPNQYSYYADIMFLKNQRSFSGNAIKQQQEIQITKFYDSVIFNVQKQFCSLSEEDQNQILVNEQQTLFNKDQSLFFLQTKSTSLYLEIEQKSINVKITNVGSIHRRQQAKQTKIYGQNLCNDCGIQLFPYFQPKLSINHRESLINMTPTYQERYLESDADEFYAKETIQNTVFDPTFQQYFCINCAMGRKMFRFYSDDLMTSAKHIMYKLIVGKHLTNFMEFYDLPMFVYNQGGQYLQGLMRNAVYARAFLRSNSNVVFGCTKLNYCLNKNAQLLAQNEHLLLDNLWTVQEVASFYVDNIHIFVGHLDLFGKDFDQFAVLDKLITKYQLNPILTFIIKPLAQGNIMSILFRLILVLQYLMKHVQNCQTCQYIKQNCQNCGQPMLLSYNMKNLVQVIKGNVKNTIACKYCLSFCHAKCINQDMCTSCYNVLEDLM